MHFGVAKLLAADSMVTKMKAIAEERGVVTKLAVGGMSTCVVLGVASFVFSNPRQIISGINILCSASAIFTVSQSTIRVLNMGRVNVFQKIPSRTSVTERALRPHVDTVQVWNLRHTTRGNVSTKAPCVGTRYAP